ncbi:MAG: FAD-binding oxidoreductase [Sporomusaceae bacterium]|nr:FAD-binding oxidoreductase [Sporomusaceae bacterium]
MSKYNQVTKELVEQLKGVVGEKFVYTDADKLEPYSHDELTDSHYTKLPEAVVLPETAEEVAKIVKLASDNNVPIIARGGGTAFTSASVALYGGIVLSVERMNKILEIDEENMFMVVEPGATTANVQKAANEKGFLYAGDPCSGDSSFIGGNVATNAGGNKAVKYGTTRQQVNGVEIVTADGELVTLGGKCKKDSTGYSLVNLMIGSEGTLGVITKCYLKLVPLAKNVFDLLAVFPDLKTAIGIVPKVMAAGITPVCVEFMDNESIKCCEKFLNEKLPNSEDGHYIIISIEGDNEELLEEQCVTIDELATEHGAMSVLVADPVRIWKARKAYAEADRSRSLIFSMEDIVVPMNKIPETVEKIAEIGQKYNIAIHCAGHAGDGNIHANILKDQLSEEEWHDKLPKLQHEIYSAVYEVGGKLSGEHGIGYKRLKLLEEYGNPVELKMMKAIKQALDPKNILNPGKVIAVD